MSSFDIEPSKFPYCQGKWDDEKNRFIQSSDIDVLRCCEDLCKNRLQYCFEQCHSRYGPNGTKPEYNTHKSCNRQCHQLRDTCHVHCFSYPPQKLTSVIECIRKQGCGSFPIVDRECMKQNKQNILTCCRGKPCEEFYDYILNEDMPLDLIAKKYNITNTEIYRPKDTSYKYPLYALLLFLLFLLAFFLLPRLSNRFKSLLSRH